ncbi:germ cell nuclear acidic protein-like isoform X2 [Ptychodera flava]|uniref:germ cell nuclear acidic protein-like isoform X2 n=1 Tax=Ptychodera flava TaxID=63121 RepID=UPI00396A12EC
MSDIEDLFQRVGGKLGWLNDDGSDDLKAKINSKGGKSVKLTTFSEVITLTSDSDSDDISSLYVKGLSRGTSSDNNSEKENKPNWCTDSKRGQLSSENCNHLKSSPKLSNEQSKATRVAKSHAVFDNIPVISSDGGTDDGNSLDSSEDDVFLLPLKDRLYRTHPPKSDTSRQLENGQNTATRLPTLLSDTNNDIYCQNEPPQTTSRRYQVQHQKNSILDSESSDDDDDFENFLASLKTPKKTINFGKTGTPITSMRKHKDKDVKQKIQKPHVADKHTAFHPTEVQTATTPQPAAKVTATLQRTSSSKPLSKDGEFLASLSSSKGQTVNSSIYSMYVRDFKRNREELTRKLFVLFNTTVFDDKLPADMQITWNCKMRKTAGFCYCSLAKPSMNRKVRIELADKVCDSAERLRDTLIHELCHAASWYINGQQGGHGPHWKYWTRKANVIHPALPMIGRCHSYEINTKFKYQCVKCGYQIGRHSKSLKTDKVCCGYCQGQFELLPPMRKDGTPARTRTPNKFALFVKENYSAIKSKEKSLRHADVMRLLSAEFSSKANI